MLKIIKNILWLSGGEVVARLLRAGLVIYAARVLGAASWGTLSYVLGLAAFFTVLADIGVSAVLTREMVRRPQQQTAYLSTSFFIKLTLVSLAAIIVIFLTPYFTRIEISNTLIVLAGILIISDNFRIFSHALTRALEKMNLEAVEKIVTQLVVLGLGVAVLIYSASAENLALAYLAGSAVGSIFIFWVLFPWLKKALFNFDRRLVKEILTAAWPFALMGMMGGIMLNTDIIMLGWFRTATDIGYYSAAQKIVLLLYVVPTLVSISTFPSLTRLAGKNKKEFADILVRSFKMVFLLGFPIVVGGILVGPQLINLIFSNEYSPASLTFQILLVTILVNFPATLIGNSLFAYSQRRTFVKFSALGAGSNIVFNLLLIPPFGIEGAAVSTIFTQIISNAYVWHKLRQLNPFSISGRLNKIIIASILMGIAVWIMSAYNLATIAIITIGAFVYLALLLIFKEKDLYFLINTFHKKLNRPKRYRHLFIAINNIKPQNILEIGTWNGLRAQQMIETAKKYHSSADIHYYGFDLFEELSQEKFNEELSKKPPSQSEVENQLKKTGAQINLFRGDTIETLPKAITKLPKMDFVFIDGGHSLKTIANDWENVRQLMHNKTVVIFDDYYEDNEDIGAKPIIDKIDRNRYDIRILKPQDRFKKSWGTLRINFVEVKPKN